MHDTVRNQFEQDGYAVLEDFLRPAECDELVAAALEFTENVADTDPKPIFSTVDADQLQLKDRYFMESNDKISFFFEPEAVGPNGELKVDPSVSLNKVGHALHLLHPIFRCYTYSDRVKAICKELGLKDPAIVQSMYIYKNPGVGGEGTCIILHGNVVHKSASNKSDSSRNAYTFHVIEREGNNYSPDNWLQEGPEAPFVNVYTTPQIE